MGSQYPCFDMFTFVPSETHNGVLKLDQTVVGPLGTVGIRWADQGGAS